MKIFREPHPSSIYSRKPHQPRMAIYLLTQCRPGNFFVLLGMVCSSWVHINVGTSRRSILLPEGREDLIYIQWANSMASRTVSATLVGLEKCSLCATYLSIYIYIYCMEPIIKYTMQCLLECYIGW